MGNRDRKPFRKISGQEKRMRRKIFLVLELVLYLIKFPFKSLFLNLIT